MNEAMEKLKRLKQIQRKKELTKQIHEFLKEANSNDVAFLYNLIEHLSGLTVSIDKGEKVLVYSPDRNHVN
jgi:hypothetical protein